MERPGEWGGRKGTSTIMQRCFRRYGAMTPSLLLL